MKPIIYHCTNGSSNKFWMYQITKTTLRVEWGRVGNTGQTKEFKFATLNQLNHFLEKKIEEKEKKGYKKISQGKLKQEEKLAETIGSRFKLGSLGFFNIKEKTPDELRLIPCEDCVADTFILIELNDSWDKSTTIRRLLSRSGTSYLLLDKVSKDTWYYIGENVKGLPELIWDYLDVEIQKVAIVLNCPFGDYQGRCLDDDGNLASKQAPRQGFKGRALGIEEEYSTDLVKKLAKLGGFGSLEGRVLEI